MKEEKLKDIVFNIYRELYINSTPSANFDELLNNAEIIDGEKQINYMNYEIDINLYKNIIEKHIKKLSKLNKQRIKNTIALGCSPKFK